MKTVKVTVDNSRIMDSIESAELSVKSPTGRTIYIKKTSLREATPDMREAFWKACNDPMVRFVGEVELTIEEMQLLFDMSKL